MKNLPNTHVLLASLALGILTNSAAYASGINDDHASEVNWSSSIDCTNALGGTNYGVDPKDSGDSFLSGVHGNTGNYGWGDNQDFTGGDSIGNQDSTGNGEGYPCDHGIIPEGLHISYTDCVPNPCDRQPNQSGQSPVPEPGSYISVLTGLGLGVLGLYRRRK